MRGSKAGLVFVGSSFLARDISAGAAVATIALMTALAAAAYAAERKLREA